jgi:GT2 family glycosyltransferase
VESKTSVRLHVLIVNYNSSDDLKDCLDSLRSEPIDQITIVDNFSAAEDYERLLVLTAALPDVRVHRSLRNLGFAGGMNLAFTIAEPGPDDVIWLVNPDTSISAGAASALVAALTGGSADIVSPVITTGSAESGIVWYGGGGVRIGAGESFHIDRMPAQASPDDFVVSTAFVTGAALMTSVRVWKALGGLREDLFLYWEDTDLSLRAVEAGYRLAVVANATMWHRVGGSSDRSGKSTAYYYYMARNRLVVCGQRTPRVGVLLGPGLRSTIRLAARAAREPENRTRKLMSVVKGSAAGLTAARS